MHDFVQRSYSMKFSNKMIVPGQTELDHMVNDARKSGGKWTQRTWAESCTTWRENKRPYLHVWPAVESALLRTKLNVDPELIPKSVIHDLRAMEVRFCDTSKRKPFMLTITEPREYETRSGVRKCEGVYVSRAWTEIDERGAGWVSAGAAIPFGETPIEDEYWHSQDDLRLAIGILMLASDAEYCTPMLLNRDIDRKLEGGDLEKAIERAKRNGKHGFDLGKSVEVSPHYRRPHFAIRWTGQGAAVPRLVPVKGSIINKELLGDVPTGYED
jgi:hypothetical protein